MMAEREESLLLEALEREPERAASAPSDVRTVVAESKETAQTEVSLLVPERAVRGRVAREQLLSDMGG